MLLFDVHDPAFGKGGKVDLLAFLLDEGLVADDAEDAVVFVAQDAFMRQGFPCHPVPYSLVVETVFLPRCAFSRRQVIHDDSP